MKPSLSIIIPSFKRIDQTLKTVQLILGSEGMGKEFKAEIIISDSSPTPELEKVLRKRFANNIVYTRPEKTGIATNKNKGAKIAKHPILIFCDSDMEVEKDTLANTIKALKNHPTGGAIGGQVIWRTGPKNGVLDRPRKEDRKITIDKNVYVEAIYSRYIATYKDVFWKVGGYDELVFNMRGEGSDLSIRYWRSGYPLIYDSSIIVHHIHKAQGGIIRNIPHPEWGIAKDLLLLAYKYDVLDEKYHNFASTIKANFEDFSNGYYRVVQGIGKYLDFIAEAKTKIDYQKKQMKTKFDFKFLEIFSEKELFRQCIQQAKENLSFTRTFF